MAIAEAHHAWFKDVCEEMKVTEIDEAIKIGGFEVDGVPLIFTESILGASNFLLLNGVVDELPQHGSLEVLRTLMTMQRHMVVPGGVTIALEDTTNTVITIQIIYPGQNSAKDVAMVLRGTAALIKQWREFVIAPLLKPKNGQHARWAATTKESSAVAKQ